MLENTVRCLAAIVLVVAAATTAHATEERTFNIPPGELAPILESLARESGLELIFQPSELKGIRTKGVTGKLSPREAIARLIDGTHLVIRTDPAGAILIAAPNPSSGSNTGADAGRAVDSLRLAGGDSESHAAQEPGRSQDEVLDDESDATRTNNDASPASEDTREAGGKLGEIVVTGTHIRGVKDVAAPSLVITRDDLANSGFQTIEQLFESLPQNFDGITLDGRFAEEGTASVRIGRVNNERATAVDLRGLGAEATLTLINGKRMGRGISGRVVDVSTIPLAAIERVEIVSGGASALYGSDAVAGVVNYVTRRGFEGVQSSISLGGPTGYDGGKRLTVSQLWGHDFGRGNLMVAYDYQRTDTLALEDTGFSSSVETPTGDAWLSRYLTPESRQHSGLVSGTVDLSDRLQIYADLFYAHRESGGESQRVFSGAPFFAMNPSTDREDIRNEHYSGGAGLRADLGTDWSLDFSAAHSVAKNRSVLDSSSDLGALGLQSLLALRDPVSRVSSLISLADGPLFTLGGLTTKAALGAEFRDERFDTDSTNVVGGVSSRTTSRKERTVRAVFAELRTPFVAGRPGLERLELSLGARYDDYDDVGSTFNWNSGLIWQVSSGLTLRGTYATAFRAPSFFDQRSSGSLTVLSVSDPANGGANSPVLFLSGNDPNVRPEEAVSTSVTLDWKPSFAEGTQLSLSWFSVEYDDRIDTPLPFAERPLVLMREERYPTLITRTPTVQDVEAFLGANRSPTGRVIGGGSASNNPTAQQLMDAFPGLALLDMRISNISIESYRGIDLKLDSRVETDIGDLKFGVNAAYALEHDYHITPTSPSVSRMNEVGKPTDLRLRGSAGWRSGAYSAFLHVNHVTHYANPFSQPPSTMGSWTTADITLRFNDASLSTEGWFRGIDASLSIQNALDREPPRFEESTNGLLYDSTNANPFGRIVSLGVTKRW